MPTRLLSVVTRTGSFARSKLWLIHATQTFARALVRFPSPLASIALPGRRALSYHIGREGSFRAVGRTVVAYDGACVRHSFAAGFEVGKL